MHGVYFGCPGMFSPRNEESFSASGGASNRSRARAKRRVLQNGTSQTELHTSLNECRERQTAPEFDRGRGVLTPAPTVRTRGKDCRFNPGWTSPTVVGRGHRTPCDAPNMARYYEHKIKRGEIPCTAPAKRSCGLTALRVRARTSPKLSIQSCLAAKSGSFVPITLSNAQPASTRTGLNQRFSLQT
jgi:hypothetical protein